MFSHIMVGANDVQKRKFSMMQFLVQWGMELVLSTKTVVVFILHQAAYFQSASLLMASPLVTATAAPLVLPQKTSLQQTPGTPRV